MTDERRDRGWALLQSIHNVVADKTVESLSGVAPDLGEMIVSFAYGDVMTRPGLDVRTRQICTVAMLAAMGGHTAPELKAHIRGALQVGWTKEEISEVLIQTAVYAGFPAAINASAVAKKAYADWDEEHVTDSDADALGISFMDCGFTQVRVAPHPGDLRWAKGLVPIPGGGDIVCSWQSNAKHFVLDVSIPTGVLLQAVLPCGLSDELIVDGESVTIDQIVKRTATEAELCVMPGSGYRFEVLRKE